MARRLIGLDIGTNAVTIAEVSAGNPPRLERFGQVALPRDAMREGEVVDDRALIDAISRLRSEVDVKKAPVRLGLASPRAVVRQVEMPAMSRDELASALRFQAGDLIPIPIDEAVLDFAILGQGTNEQGEPVMQVLLVAAHEAPTARLVSCVESAGLSVEAVDLLPLALIRSLTHSAMGEEGTHAEGIVSFGGGVTAIAVHEQGVPRFVRVLGSGGRELTDAIAAELGMPVETAEALKRQLSHGNDELVGRARNAIERPLALLLDEVRSSLDYYRNQPGAARLERVVVTGGASQLPGLTDRLSTLVGLPAQPAAPRQGLAIGDIRFPVDEYPRLDPYLPAAVGLALGGAGIGTVVDLAPRRRKRSKSASSSDSGSPLKVAVAVAVGLIVLLGVPTFLAKQAVADKEDEHEEVVAQNDAMKADIAEKAPLQAAHDEVDAIEAQLATLLATDVSWSHMLQDVSKTMPANVWLTSFQGQVAAPVPVAPTTTPETEGEGAETDDSDDAAAATPVAPVTPALAGTVTIEAHAVDYPDVASWLRQLGNPVVFPAFTSVWVSSAAEAEGESGTTVDFSSSASLTEAARSNRLQQLQGGVE
jgi:type IV pilus assembly protein PilM